MHGNAYISHRKTVRNNTRRTLESHDLWVKCTLEPRSWTWTHQDGIAMRPSMHIHASRQKKPRMLCRRRSWSRWFGGRLYGCEQNIQNQGAVVLMFRYLDMSINIDYIVHFSPLHFWFHSFDPANMHWTPMPGSPRWNEEVGYGRHGRWPPAVSLSPAVQNDIHWFTMLASDSMDIHGSMMFHACPGQPFDSLTSYL